MILLDVLKHGYWRHLCWSMIPLSPSSYNPVNPITCGAFWVWIQFPGSRFSMHFIFPCYN